MRNHFQCEAYLIQTQKEPRFSRDINTFIDRLLWARSLGPFFFGCHRESITLEVEGANERGIRGSGTQVLRVAWNSTREGILPE